MKHRFESHETQKRSPASKNFLISIVGFLAIVILFWVGTSLLSEKTDSQEAEILEDAVTRCIVHCYSSEGFYPENLQYLKENYGLTYNEERFLINYHPLGSNILPDVTIIDRRDVM